MCTLRPHDPARSGVEAPECKTDADCFIDIPTARCFAQGQPAGPILAQGPYCACDRTKRRCQLAWQEPVACKSWRDCSWTLEGRARAVPSRTHPRPVPRPVKPCADAERDSVCTEADGKKLCRLVAWKC